MFNKVSFPSVPDFFAEWRTVYFEPIPNSGERIAILIVIKSMNGKIEIFDALHPTVIDSLYGSKASSFNGYLKLIKLNILKNDGESTIDGVDISTWHSSQSVNIQGIVKQALYKTASLGAVALKSLFEQEDSYVENEQVDTRWSKRIKNAVIEIDPSYEKSFDIKIPIRRDVKILCGFHTSRYSAKFNVCTSQTITRMKSNLMDLQIFDSHHVSDKFDLIIQMPTDDNLQVPLKTLARMKENIELLKEEVASKTNISIYTCNSEKEGAARIFEMLEAS
ncbi:hypothetical protein [Acinetobacter radioresistens]|uniref:hypothetical protein n=1 Tax=Acinetobacter radioresistens TaxID=40216 RepID=UPI00125EDE19|nr:hypothetical protein [Acinetobacter radioresistens]